MKTKLYEEPKLEGNFIELDYGSYKFQILCQKMSQFKSIELAPHAMITLYSQDNFRGPKHVITNSGNKVLKVTGFENDFNLPIRSIIIECACNLDRNQFVEYRIIKADFERNNQIISYTYFWVIPEPLSDPLDPPSPFNPVVLIIPDFGVDNKVYECMQDKLAQRRFSSIVLDIRGVGQSYSAQSVKYADIIQDYRYIAKELNQMVKKPIVIGHGIGGAIAQLWAITYKFELRNLILIGSAPYAVYSQYLLPKPTLTQWLNGTITTSQFATAVANVTYNTPSEDCEVEKLKLDITNSINAADTPTLKRLFTQNPDMPSLATSPRTIIIPTLIIHGTQDAHISITGSENLFNLINNSRIRRFNTGHTPHFTIPTRTLEAIYNFLAPDGRLYL